MMMRQLKFEFEFKPQERPAEPETASLAAAQEWPHFISRLRWHLGLSQEQFANSVDIFLRQCGSRLRELPTLLPITTRR